MTGNMRRKAEGKDYGSKDDMKVKERETKGRLWKGEKCFKKQNNKQTNKQKTTK